MRTGAQKVQGGMPPVPTLRGGGVDAKELEAFIGYFMSHGRGVNTWLGAEFPYPDTPKMRRFVNRDGGRMLLATLQPDEPFFHRLRAGAGQGLLLCLQGLPESTVQRPAVRLLVLSLLPGVPVARLAARATLWSDGKVLQVDPADGTPESDLPLLEVAIDHVLSGLYSRLMELAGAYEDGDEAAASM